MIRIGWTKHSAAAVSVHPYGGLEMNSTMIAEWAQRNGYRPTGAGALHKKTDKGLIAIELKPKSMVMILDTPGAGMPRIRTRLYKDLSLDPASGDVFLPDL